MVVSDFHVQLDFVLLILKLVKYAFDSTLLITNRKTDRQMIVSLFLVDKNIYKYWNDTNLSP